MRTEQPYQHVISLYSVLKLSALQCWHLAISVRSKTKLNFVRFSHGLFKCWLLCHLCMFGVDIMNLRQRNSLSVICFVLRVAVLLTSPELSSAFQSPRRSSKSVETICWRSRRWQSIEMTLRRCDPWADERRTSGNCGEWGAQHQKPATCNAFGAWREMRLRPDSDC